MPNGDKKIEPHDNVEQHQEDPQLEIAASQQLTRLPAFWDNNPRTWFLTAEIMFDANKITSDRQKFAHTVLSLSAIQAEKVGYILQDPPAEQKYETIKRALIERYSISEERRLETVLGKIELGDQKPSDLLHRIKTLAEKDFTVNVITKLWIRQLPDYIQTALIPQQEKREEELADIADKLHDMVGTRTQSLSSVNRNARTSSSETHMPSNSNTRIEHMLKQINDRLTCLEKEKNQQRQFSRSQSPRRETTSPSRANQFTPTEGNHMHKTTNQQTKYQSPQNWCWYHGRFGNKASKCTPPCSFVKQHMGSSNTGSPNR